MCLFKENKRILLLKGNLKKTNIISSLRSTAAAATTAKKESN